MLTSPFYGYDHRDISAGLRQVLHVYLLVQPSAIDVLVSQLQRIQTYLLVDATLTDMHAGRVKL